MTIAHKMLSLTGSLQPDPFNPAHVPGANKSVSKTVASSVVESDSTTAAKSQSAIATAESTAQSDSESTIAAKTQSTLDMAPLPYSESESSSKEE